MNKMLVFAVAAAVSAQLFADEPQTQGENADKAPIIEAPRKNVGVWPAFIAISEIPSADRTPDIVGLRVTVPCSLRHESVTGVDIGLWGVSRRFEGFMLNILRNNVRDSLAGIQVGLYNSAAQADLLGIQVGLWNEADSVRGVQAGLINVAGIAQGLQVGIINRAEEMYGLQVGLVNVIRGAELQFFPIANIGF